MPVGYIYKLESSFEDPGLYVGSTKDLKQRKSQHKYRCNKSECHGYNLKLYKYIREYGGFNNWFMLTLEEFEYEDKKELIEREDYWIKELKPNLNGHDAVQDKEKLKKNHNQKQKQYYDENKKKVLEKMKEKFDCECGAKYTYGHKTRHINTAKHQSYLSSKVI